MKVRRILFVCLAAAAIIVSGFITDDDPLKNIAQKLEKYLLQFPQEKIHIHTDKPYYAIGDNIWFKAYLVNAEKNQLSAVSKVIYVDLINEKDSIKQSLRLLVSNGLAWGDFKLDDDLPEGNYRIRAYTTWMRNFGEAFFFDKTITIGNSVSNNYLTDVAYTFKKTGNSEKVTADIQYTDLDGNPVAGKEVTYDVQLEFRDIAKGKAVTDKNGKIQITFVNNQPFILKSGRISTRIKLADDHIISKTIPVKATSNEVAVQFFPEGGDLINGIRTRVGFKAVGADGLGVNIKGYISDQDNNKIAEITAEHAGMGSFMMLPAADRHYKATVRFADGSEKAFELPRVLQEGYGLAVRHLKSDSIVVKVSISPSLRDKGPITVVAHTNGIINYSARTNVTSTTFSTAVATSRFPSGILHFTVFSAKSEPLAERLVFIRKNDQLNIQASTAKDQFRPREKVKISFDVKDGQAVSRSASLSVAVTDESKVPSDENDETTILSNLLLTSDIKGYVEQPAYYFNNNNEDTERQLDNLLLTQGWRRFAWKSILSDAFPAISYKPEAEADRISGQVLASNGDPVIGGKVTLFSSSGDVFLIDTLTDSNGRFNFDRLIFADSTKFVIQARTAKDRKNVEIIVDQLPPQLVTKNKNAADIEINVNRSINPYLQNSRKQFEDLRSLNMNRSILLSEVKIVEQKQKVTRSANLNGAGNADAILTADDLQHCYSLLQCLNGRVAGLIIQNGVPYLMRNMPVPMQVIIDGVPSDPTFLDAVHPNDVQSIEILKSIGNTAIYGLRGGGGVLVLTTKEGTSGRSYRSYTPGIISHAPKGFYKVREFYSPNYDDPQLDKNLPDLRTTVYWNPHVVSDAEGKAHVEFFNADGTGNYKVVVEGINVDGKIGRTVYRYKVK